MEGKILFARLVGQRPSCMRSFGRRMQKPSAATCSKLIAIRYILTADDAARIYGMSFRSSVMWFARTRATGALGSVQLSFFLGLEYRLVRSSSHSAAV